MEYLGKVWRFVKHRPEGFFAITAFVFGGIFILFIPPLQTPDETTHFMRAYQVSQLNFIPEKHNGEYGYVVPKSLTKTIQVLSDPMIRFKPSLKYNLHTTKAALNIPLNKHNTAFIESSAGYSPVGYIPQAVGIFIGTVFNSPAVVLMYIARLFALLGWIIVIFFAIRLMPYKKWGFAALALLPMLVAQSISPGVDALSISLAVLFIASVLYLHQKKQVTQKWWIGLVAIGCLMSLTKETSILALGFTFLLNTRWFSKKTWVGYIKKSLIITLPILLLLVWMIISAVPVSINKTQDGIPGQNSTGQIKDMVENPLRFPQVFVNTFFSNYGDGVIKSFIGDFGWVDTPLPETFIGIGFILIAFILFTNYESRARHRLSRLQQWIVGIITGLYVIGSAAALYIAYTPVNFAIIYGLQGRYFLLILFMLMPILAGIPLMLKEVQYKRVVAYGVIGMLTVSIITIFLRYYINFPV